MHATIATIPASGGEGGMQTLQHLHFTARQRVESPGFPLTDILSRACGVGATVAGFTVIYGVLLHGLATAGYAQQSASGSVSVVQPGAPGTPSRRLPPSTSARGATTLAG